MTIIAVWKKVQTLERIVSKNMTAPNAAVYLMK